MVVWLSGLSGRALVLRASGVLGSTPGDCRTFHFSQFLPHNIYFQCEARCSEHLELENWFFSDEENFLVDP